MKSMLELRIWRLEFAAVKDTPKMKDVVAAFRDEYGLHHLKGWEIFALLREKDCDEVLRIASKAELTKPSPSPTAATRVPETQPTLGMPGSRNAD